MADKENGEAAVLAAIKEMEDADRIIAEKIHELVNTYAPSLVPKTFYGMPGYANEKGKIVCFFQSGVKYKNRYSTLGFQQDATLDDGNMWPVAFAIKALSSSEESRIIELLKKATS